MISKKYNKGNRRYKFLLSIPIAVALFAMFSLKVEAKYVYAKHSTVNKASTPVSTRVTVANSTVDSTAVKKLVEVCHTLYSEGKNLKDFTFIQVKPGEERTYSFVLSKGTKYCFATTSNANKLVIPWLFKAGNESKVVPVKMLTTSDKHATTFYDISETAVYKLTINNATSKSFDMASTMFFIEQFEVDKPKISNKDSVLAIDPGENETFFIVENMPEFESKGLEHARSYLQSQLKYPEAAKANGINGKVYISFVVNIDGKVENVKIIRSVEPSLDKEAVRVVSEMPKWTPGTQKGKAVNVAFTIPIKFE